MCFYACTASVYVQTILVLIMPLCTECECKEGVYEGDVEFSMENHCRKSTLGFSKLRRSQASSLASGTSQRDALKLHDSP